MKVDHNMADTIVKLTPRLVPQTLLGTAFTLTAVRMGLWYVINSGVMWRWEKAISSSTTIKLQLTIHLVRSDPPSHNTMHKLFSYDTVLTDKAIILYY